MHYGTVLTNGPLGRPGLSNDRICTQVMDLTRHGLWQRWVITEELVTAISRVMSANPEMSRTRDLNFLGYARKPRGAYLQSTSRPRFPGVPLLSSKMTLIQYKVIKKES